MAKIWVCLKLSNRKKWFFYLISLASRPTGDSTCGTPILCMDETCSHEFETIVETIVETLLVFAGEEKTVVHPLLVVPRRSSQPSAVIGGLLEKNDGFPW